MSSAIDYVRYSCGIAGEEVANYVDQLQAEVAELEAENARLKAASFFGKSKDIHALAETVLSDCGCSSLHWPLMEKVENRLYTFFDEQLAAEQLNNKRLREALEAVKPHVQCDPYAVVIRALSLHASTEELDAYVKQKIKEYN